MKSAQKDLFYSSLVLFWQNIPFHYRSHGNEAGKEFFQRSPDGRRKVGWYQIVWFSDWLKSRSVGRVGSVGRGTWLGIRALFAQWAGHPQTTSHCLFKGPCWPKTRTPSFWVKISEKYHAFSGERRWCSKCVAALLLCQCLHGVIMFGRHMEAIVFIYHPLTEMFIYHPRLILFSALTPHWHSILYSSGYRSKGKLIER